MVITLLTPTGLRTLVPTGVSVMDLRQRLTLLFRTAADHVIFVRGEKGSSFAPWPK